MTTNSIYLGQSRVVGFFAVCCVLAGLGLFRGLVSGGRIRPGFAIAECAFVLIMGIAAWYLYQSKEGRLVFNVDRCTRLVPGLADHQNTWSAYTIAFTFGVFAVLVWLLQPRVKANYGEKI